MTVKFRWTPGLAGAFLCVLALPAAARATVSAAQGGIVAAPFATLAGSEPAQDKPDTSDLPEAKRIFLKKACEAPVADVQNGQPGVAWHCQVDVAALPAPFAGVFSFVEDASAMAGANGQITSVAASPAWSCPGLPAATTTCTIAGSDFDGSGVETLSFELFAPATGPVAWKNCVSGLYAGRDGKTEVKGNCDAMEWKPERPQAPKPEKTGITKTCTEPTEQRHNGTLWGLSWNCDVTVTVAPAPFAGSFSFVEDASGIIGAAGAEIISVNAGPGWTCTPASGSGQAQTSCSINGGDFPASGSDTLHFELFADMANVPEQAVTWENCVSGATDPAASPREVADCVTTTWAPEPTLPEPQSLDITKSCTQIGEGPYGNDWGRSWRCDITVAASPAPFGGTLHLVEDATALTGASGGSIMGVPGPFCSPAPGIGTDQVTCNIDGASFPASGQQVYTFNLFSVSPDQATPGSWENCVTATAGTRDATACDTMEWTGPPPALEVTKTCDDPVPAGMTGWDVSCTVTVTGANLQPGLEITLYDTLTGMSGANPQSGTLAAPASLPGSAACGGSISPPGMILRTCTVSTDDLIAAGGTLSFPYTGHLGLGAGGNPAATNCASFQLRDAQGNGIPVANSGVAQCVPLALPTLPTTTGGTAPDCGVDVLFVVDRSGSMNWHNRIAQVRAGVQMAQNAFAGNGSNGGLILFSSNAAMPVPLPDPLPSGAIATQMANLTAYGGTRWSQALQRAQQAVTQATDKPLVLFVTDGMPSEPWTLSQGPVAAIRAQGSRIIGIGMGNGVNATMMNNLLGANTADVGAGDVPDPFTDDVVLIPDGADMAAVFGQMAHAYCPGRAARAGIGQVIDLHLPVQPFAGDDELPVAAPPARPSLSLDKAALGDCTVDTARRRYGCSFALTVTNTGGQPLAGPVTVVERPGKPAPVVLSGRGEGWECDRLRDGELTCLARDLRLAPGQSSRITVRASIAGDPPTGPRWPNCAGIGLPGGKAGRVALAQRLMNARGIDAGPVDGAPGPRTYRALSQLRAQLGLPDSRAFDDALFAALGLPAEGPRACSEATLPPMPAPVLRCDPATTRAVEGGCACSDPERMLRRSETQCACKNGLPAINGKCVQLPQLPDGPAGDSCRIRVNGICLSR